MSLCSFQNPAGQRGFGGNGWEAAERTSFRHNPPGSFKKSWLALCTWFSFPLSECWLHSLATVHTSLPLQGGLCFVSCWVWMWRNLVCFAGLGWGFVCWVICCSVLSRVWLCATPWTVATMLLCPWNFPGKNAGVGCHFLLQGIFPTQESNPRLLCLLHCRWILYHSCHLGSPSLLGGSHKLWASLRDQLVKNPPAMQETPIGFLGWEDPLEKG